MRPAGTHKAFGFSGLGHFKVQGFRVYAVSGFRVTGSGCSDVLVRFEGIVWFTVVRFGLQ